jgi:hypothetical protein
MQLAWRGWNAATENDRDVANLNLRRSNIRTKTEQLAKTGALTHKRNGTSAKMSPRGDIVFPAASA